MNTILEIKSISKSFVKINKRKGISEKVFLLNNLNLNIQKGKITALIGGNGAGKTTLFNIISGFLEPDNGEIIFNNGKPYRLTGMKPHKIEQLGIGRLFQDNHIFPELTVLENLMIAHEDDFGEMPLHVLFYPRKTKELEKQREQKALHTLEMLFGENNAFLEKKDELAKNMSHGQQRLLGLARLFMANYKLVLLDEPTAGVNPKLNDTFAEIIKRMVTESDITVFLIEHNMRFVKQVADYCAFLNNGKIEVFGSPEEVIADEKVRKSYLGT